MKAAEFHKRWPDLKGKYVTVLYGYVRPQKYGCKLEDTFDSGEQIYLKSADGQCFTVRAIKSITQ